MKVYTNICIFFGLLFSGIAQGQINYKPYNRSKTTFQIKTEFNPGSTVFLTSNSTNHLWLTNLNGQYVDTTKNKMNAFAIPEYHEIKNRGLFGPRNVTKQMNAGLYYHPYFFRTIPNRMSVYDPINMPYSQLPYGYSSFSIKASGSPYFILPKF